MKWYGLSWRRPLSYRNQSIDLLLCKSMDWILYDNDLRHKRVNLTRSLQMIHFLIILTIFKTVIMHDFRKTWWRDFEKTLKVLISGLKMTHLRHFLAYWELSFKIQSRYFYPFITVCSHIQLQKKIRIYFKKVDLGPIRIFLKNRKQPLLIPAIKYNFRKN